MPAMIVDFQHHFTPRELIKEDPGDRLVLHYDPLGAPSYTVHSLLYDLDEHVRMMDLAGIDAAWLTSAPECAPILHPRGWSTTKPAKPSAITRGASSAPRMRIRLAAPPLSRNSPAAAMSWAFRAW